MRQNVIIKKNQRQMISNQLKQSTNKLKVKEQVESFKNFNEHNFVRLIRHVHRQVTVNMNKRLEACGYDDISARHFSVFDHLDFEGTNIVTLAQRANITKQAMGKLVKEASLAGYVETNTDPIDSRSLIVQFTEKGLHLLKNVQNEMNKACEIILKAIFLSTDDMKITMSTLSRISAYFDSAHFQHDLFFSEMPDSVI
jgi:DNA-binding MarR family transcriptional regulator